MTEWQLYAQKVEGESWVGEKIEAGKIDKMSGNLHLSMLLKGLWLIGVDQQLGQMYELMQAIRKRELEDNEGES